VDIENEMYIVYKGVGKDYKQKFRSLCFNLKDEKNPDLRQDVLYGNITPKQLLQMSPEDMASKEMAKQRQEIARKKMEEIKPDRDSKAASTDQFRCGKCHKRETTYYQMQTRSADEPMTTFVTCTNCGNRWKM